MSTISPIFVFIYTNNAKTYLMKVWSYFFLMFASIFSYAQDEELHRCIQHTVPIAASEREQIDRANEQLTNFLNRPNFRSESIVYKIPVVVHVVYNSDKDYVSVQQVKTQIEVLNKDYNRKNSDTSLAPQVFKNIASGIEIEFSLARLDPNGNSTTGITFTKTTQTSFSYSSDQVKYTSLGGHDAWDPSRYLNIWVCSLAGGILGYVPYPMVVGAKNDGVAISYRAFGTIGNLSQYFNLGRTATHEVGHWLGLYHPWGKPDASGCTTDEVDDTPPQARETDYKPSSCPAFPYLDTASKCNNLPNGRLFSNFMDYTRDACMNMFTVGQAKKMRAFLEINRSSILSSNALNAPYDHDIAISELRLDTTSYCNGEMVIPKLTVINLGNDTIKSYKLTLSVNGQKEVKIFSLPLAPLEDTVLLFSSVNEPQLLNDLEANAEILMPQADQFSKNNTSTISFSCTSLLSIFPNPVIDYLRVRGNSPNVISATFYNLAGKEMLKIENPYDIDVSQLVPGSYLVVFETDTNKIRQQFIVIH